MQMLGDGYLSPEAGVSCFERCDSVLHPLNRFADKLNEEYSSPVCHLTLPSTGRLYPETRKVIRSFKHLCPQKRYKQAMGHLSKVKYRKEEQRSQWEAGRGNKSQRIGGQQKKTEWLRKRDGCPGEGLGNKSGLASCNLWSLQINLGPFSKAYL